MILSFLAVILGCVEWNRTQKGAALGAGTGGAVGGIIGYGMSDPIASNDTAEGRAQNRRVEVAIWANEKLKKVAKDKTS